MKLSVALVSFCFSLPLIASSSIESQPAFPIVQGNWRNVDQKAVRFVELHMFSEEAVFTSRGDTVYRFGYRLNVSPGSTTLQLTDTYGKALANRLLKANNDSLVFASLWSVNRVQRFYKIHNK